MLLERTLEKLEKAAEVIRGDGGQAHTTELDALDEQVVGAHADGVARDTGGIDISFNLITPGDFARPVEIPDVTGSRRHMIIQSSGVIPVFGGEGDPPRGYHLGGLQVALHAMEALRRRASDDV